MLRPVPRVTRAVVAVALAAIVVAGGLVTPSGVAAAADPIATGDGGVISTTLIPTANRFPTGSGTQRQISRDCGHSVEVPGNRSLWLFCDTAIYDDITGSAPSYTGRTRFVHSGTAGLAPTETDPTPSDPVRLTEKAYPALPTQFITSSGRYGTARTPITCNGGGSTFAWTKSLVALPGTNKVLAFFQDHCPDLESGYAAYDIGVGEVALPDVADGDVSGGDELTVTQRYDSIQINPTPGSAHPRAYASSAVVDGPYLYLYGLRTMQTDCSSGTCRITYGGAVELARVTWADGGYRDQSKYRYYTGQGADPWSATESAAVNVLPDASTPAGDGMAVAWQPELGRYVMIHADTPFGTVTGPDIRTSPTPWGPWSTPVVVKPNTGSAHGYPSAGCDDPVSCRSYTLQPQLSGGSKLWFGYVRQGDLATANGQPATVQGSTGMTVRLASVPFSALPTPDAGGATLPNAPTALVATPGDRSATVTWVAPLPKTGATIIGYQVIPYIGSTPQPPVMLSSTATSGVVRGLDNTRTYTFAVRAVTAAGFGPASLRSAVTIPLGSPRAPTNVNATPGDTSATVSWTAPTNTGGSPITGYEVTPIKDGVAQTPRVLQQTATSKVIASLSNGASYSFTVRAVTALGKSDDSAATTAVTPFGVPGAPSGVAGTPRNGAVALTWDAPEDNGGSPVTGYRVTPYLGSTAQTPVTLTTTARSTLVEGLENGSSYTFRVAAVNARGVGPSSAASAAVVPRTTAGAPTGLAVVNGDRRLTFTWTAPIDTGGSPITGYRITPSVDGVFGDPIDITGTDTRYVMTGLTNGRMYRIVVAALTAAGPGTHSGFSPAGYPRTTPKAPTGITVSAGVGAVRVGYTPPADDGGAQVTGYRITPYTGSTALPARSFTAFGSSQVIDGLSNGTPYTFTVQAVNEAGPGAVAYSPSATPRTTPGAPGPATATARDRSALVSWSAPTQTGGATVTGYQVTPWANGSALPTRTYDSPATSQIVTGLANGTGYTFTVRAVNPAGFGASTGFSNSVTPAPVTTSPSAPYATWDAMVRELYADVAGRAPSSSERTTWVNRLSSGQDEPGDLVAALRASDDQVKIVDPVARLYRAYFLRPPDAGGLDFWISKRRAGNSLYWISEAFARSAEFTTMYGSLSNTEFMELVYRQVLDREPEAAGMRYWVGQLDTKKKTRGQVMVGFSEAAEYKTTHGHAIEGSVAYLRLLGRAPSTSELQTWVSRRRSGTSAATLYDELIVSPEHASRVG